MLTRRTGLDGLWTFLVAGVVSVGILSGSADAYSVAVDSGSPAPVFSNLGLFTKH